MVPIHRPYYEDLLMKYMQLPEIKILKGVRRCGKSTLLTILHENLCAKGVNPAQIFYRSFDEYEVPIKADAVWLKAQIDDALARTDENKTFYVLLDEIQTVDSWEEVVRRLYRRTDTQIVLTGSNAHLLSSDLATHLAGRYIELEVMPLQFSEYRSFCDFYGWSFNSELAMFESFLSYGGMPGLFQFDQHDTFGKERMLSGIFDTVVMNDVALRTRVSDFTLLSKLIRYVFSTSGNLFSVKKVSDALSSAGKKTSPDTVEIYLEALENALILNGCEQYGLCGKNVLRPLRKFYPIDNGLRNLTSGFQATNDTGYKLENIVYNELRHRGYDIKVGALSNGEIDFVATKDAQHSYFQVTTSVADEAVMSRETSPLDKIGNSFPKTVLTMDGLLSGFTETGVCIQGISEWLLR